MMITNKKLNSTRSYHAITFLRHGQNESHNRMKHDLVPQMHLHRGNSQLSKRLTVLRRSRAFRSSFTHP